MLPLSDLWDRGRVRRGAVPPRPWPLLGFRD